MKRKLQILLGDAVRACIDKKLIEAEAIPYIEIDIPKDAGHGDYASNVAMVLASRAKGKLPPRRIAEIISKHISSEDDALVRSRSQAPAL